MRWRCPRGIRDGFQLVQFVVDRRRLVDGRVRRGGCGGLAVKTVTPRHVFRIGFHFGLFQFLIAGSRLAAGRNWPVYIGAYGPWLALLLLGGVGGKMLWESFGPKDEPPQNAIHARASCF